MLKTRICSALAVLAVVMLAAGAIHERAGHAERQDLAAEVAALKERVVTLEGLIAQTTAIEERAASTDAKLRLQDDAVNRLFTFFGDFPKALDALDKQMDDARLNGFEKAGPNPAAKTNVLDGIKTFCATVKAMNPNRKGDDAKTAVK